MLFYFMCTAQRPKRRRGGHLGYDANPVLHLHASILNIRDLAVDSEIKRHCLVKYRNTLAK